MMVWFAWCVTAFCGALILANLVAFLVDLRSPNTHGWATTFREWQGSFSTISGALLAACVLLVGYTFEVAEREAERSASIQKFGKAAAVEAESLAAMFVVGRDFGSMAEKAGVPWSDICEATLDMMARFSTDHTPVYDAMVADIREAGEINVVMFVRFHAQYRFIKDYIARVPKKDCARDGQGVVKSLFDHSEMGMKIYRNISQIYATATHEEGSMP